MSSIDIAANATKMSASRFTGSSFVNLFFTDILRLILNGKVLRDSSRQNAAV